MALNRGSGGSLGWVGGVWQPPRWTGWHEESSPLRVRPRCRETATAPLQRSAAAIMASPGHQGGRGGREREIHTGSGW